MVATLSEVIEKHYFVPCPHCGEYIELVFPQLRWKPGKPETAVYVCQECGGEITDLNKTGMFAAGRWREVARQPGQQAMPLRTNTLYSSIIRFSDIAEEFMRCVGEVDLMKSFYLFWLAEPLE